MARTSRLIVSEMAHYVFLKGNHNTQVFVDNADKTQYYEMLCQASKRYHVDIMAYAFLSKSVHFIARPKQAEDLSKMVQLMGRCYVPYYNKKYQFSGALWEDRFKSSVIDSSNWLINCMKFIEMLPLEMGETDSIEDYLWTSFRHHAGYKHDALIVDPAVYWEMGNTPFDRELVYKSFANEPLSPEDFSCIQSASTKGWPIGSPNFIQRLSETTGRVFRMGRRGRPIKDKK